MKSPNFLIRPISASLFWGLIGGITLIAITFLSHKGFIETLPYPIILIAALLFLKFNDTSDKAFIRMFLTGFSVCVIMSVILVIYIQLFVNEHVNTFSGYMLSFSLIIGTAFLSSLSLSILAKPVKKDRN